MKVLIVGCGRVGGLLAGGLDAEGHEVTIIDENRAQFEKNLPQSFNGATVLGSGIDMDVLRGDGIETWSRTTILSEIIHDLLTGREKESGTLLDRARRREAILAGDVVPES